MMIESQGLLLRFVVCWLSMEFEVSHKGKSCGLQILSSKILAKNLGVWVQHVIWVLDAENDGNVSR